VRLQPDPSCSTNLIYAHDVCEMSFVCAEAVGTLVLQEHVCCIDLTIRVLLAGVQQHQA